MGKAFRVAGGAGFGAGGAGRVDQEGVAGGKARLETNISHLSEPFSQLIYDLELLYIK